MTAPRNHPAEDESMPREHCAIQALVRHGSDGELLQEQYLIGPYVDGNDWYWANGQGHDVEEDRIASWTLLAPVGGSSLAPLVASLTISHRRIVSATVFAAYDDGTTEIHSVARGGKNTKLTIDLSEEA